MFSILIWPDSCSYCPASCTCLCWLALLALCVLFCHASGIVRLRALHSTFKLYFTNSSVTGRLPSFFPGHSVSLALLAHWSFLTTFPLVAPGAEWNGRPLKDFEEITLDAAEQQSFQSFLISVSSKSQVPLIHIEILQSFFGLPWFTALNKRENAYCIMNFVISPMFSPT